MLQRTARLRLALGAFASLQLALPGLASWADARFEAAASGAKAHIESHTSATCVRIHGSDCVLCRFLSGTALASRVAAPVAIRDVGVAVAPVSFPAARTVPERGLPQSRAPPTLS